MTDIDGGPIHAVYLGCSLQSAYYIDLYDLSSRPSALVTILVFDKFM